MTDIVERLRHAHEHSQQRIAGSDIFKAAEDEITKLRAEREALADPVVVHLNMLRGGIAKPSWANIQHLYPEETAAAARDMRERAAMAVRNKICTIHWPPEDGDELIDCLMAVIRTLPDTPAVIATDQKGGAT